MSVFCLETLWTDDSSADATNPQDNFISTTRSDEGANPLLYPTIVVVVVGVDVVVVKKGEVGGRH